MSNPKAFLRFPSLSKPTRLVVGLLLGILVVALMCDGVMEAWKPASTGPSWRGIIPGKTTESEVRSILGPPNTTSICETWPDLQAHPSFNGVANCFVPPWRYTYKEARIPGHLPARHEIRFRFNKVLAVVEDLSDSPDASSPQLLRALVREYGPPERVSWVKQFPEFFRAFVFCDHGVIVLADDVHAGSRLYFPPMSLPDCFSEFEADIASEDPFPNPQFPRSENPWPWLISGQ